MMIECRFTTLDRPDSIRGPPLLDIVCGGLMGLYGAEDGGTPVELPVFGLPGFV